MDYLSRLISRNSSAEPTDHSLPAAPGEVGNADAELHNFRDQHRWDPFLDVQKLENVDAAISSGDVAKETAIDESLIQENSPYPEVCSSVPPTDTQVPVDTVRSWCIGLVTCTVVAACNVLLGLRRSPITISATVVQLISYPVGCAWAKVVPEKSIRLFGKEIEVNPGPFNVKEHTIITMMTAAGSMPSYAIDILLAQEIFYQQYFKWGFQILLIVSTQAMGFGLAGISRRFLIWPSAMVWPGTLVTTTVMYSLHDRSRSDPAATNGWRIGRYRFFLLMALITFIWAWVPQVFAIFLQLFMFPVWIAPENTIVNQLFGGQTGLGILPISFDWSVISGFLLSPLQTPAFAIFNIGAGILLMFIGVIGLAWAGPSFYRYLPITANQNFDNTANPYNTSRILNPDFTVNLEAYRAYSPLFLGPAFSLSYGMGFATLVSTLTHVLLFYGADIWRRAKNARSEEPDVHLKLMRKYKEAPELWFLSVFVLSLGFGMTASQVWATQMPWWTFVVAVAIAAFFIVPIGIVQAITNQQPGLNVLSEMVFGYILPGRPVAMMLFKSFCYMTCYNGLNYVSDMKIGHYMKIPPRSMFAAQLFAVIWLSIVQICTYNFLRGNIDGICTETQSQGLTCPGARTFYNASVIWGAIGPRIVFGAGGIYSWVNWFWFIGFACPLIQYRLARRYPRSLLRYIFFPALFGAAGMIPPATMWYLAQYVIIGIIFNWWIKRRFPGWWSRYNFTLSGALDIGTAFCVVIQDLALGLGNVSFPEWWGNSVPFANLDAVGGAVSRKLPADGSQIIGPASW
ncbi:OPT oligopeptide transporter protein [Sarocladium implicatum]|nr:OPT oligopeptide transporter protein [Sarocladium implicatum]